MVRWPSGVTRHTAQALGAPLELSCASVRGGKVGKWVELAGAGLGRVGTGDGARGALMSGTRNMPTTGNCEAYLSPCPRTSYPTGHRPFPSARRTTPAGPRYWPPAALDPPATHLQQQLHALHAPTPCPRPDTKGAPHASVPLLHFPNPPAEPAPRPGAATPTPTLSAPP